MARFASFSLLAILALFPVAAQAQCSANSLVANSSSGFNFTPFRQAIQSALASANVPGAAFAISYQGKLQALAAFGCSDTTAGTAMKQNALFRIASVSKTFTAIGILQLVQAGKLSLSDAVFSKLTNFQPLPGQKIDPQVAQITVQQLLQHTGGFDRSVNHKYQGSIYGDAVDSANIFATAEGLALPGTCADTITAIMSQPLDHPPGTVYAYSNTGYCILGRVIEKISGMGYEQYVQQKILTPLGIGRQKLGATLLSDIVNGETTYYDVSGAPLVQSVFPASTAVARPYGQRFIETLDSTGGWVANVTDLVRFVDSIDGRKAVPNGTSLLTPNTLSLFTAYTPATGFTATSYYGLGFSMTVVPDGIRWTKDGAFAGTASYLFHGPSGYSYAIIFNSDPDYGSTTSGTEDLPAGGLIPTVVSSLQTLIDNSPAPTGATDLFNNATLVASTLLTPAITSVVQGATYAAQPGIVPGSFASIFGTNLGTSSRAWWGDEFINLALPTEIDHVLVTIDGKNAAVAYVSPGQLNVQVPADTATGPVNVQVTRDGTVSANFTAQLTQSAPGFFAYTIGGTTYVAAQHADGSTLGDPAVLPGATLAKPGETVQLYGTGFGPTTTGLIPTTVMPLTSLPIVSVGGAQAFVPFAGINQFAGVVQINVTIPVQLAAGNQVITASFGGATSPASVVIPVGSK